MAIFIKVREHGYRYVLLYVVLKHFGWEVLHKEPFPFLFAMYVLKMVFCKDTSIEYGFEPCAQIFLASTYCHAKYSAVLHAYCDADLVLHF